MKPSAVQALLAEALVAAKAPVTESAPGPETLSAPSRVDIAPIFDPATPVPPSPVSLVATRQLADSKASRIVDEIDYLDPPESRVRNTLSLMALHLHLITPATDLSQQIPGKLSASAPVSFTAGAGCSREWRPTRTTIQREMPYLTCFRLAVFGATTSLVDALLPFAEEAALGSSQTGGGGELVLEHTTVQRGPKKPPEPAFREPPLLQWLQPAGHRNEEIFER